MKPLYIVTLTLTLTLGNCKTTNYSPEGIDQKLKSDAQAANYKKVKYKVDLEIEGMGGGAAQQYDFKDDLNKSFISDKASPIQLKINNSIEESNVMFAVACFILPIPCKLTKSNNYSIAYGFENSLIEKKINRSDNVYMISFFSLLPALIFGYVPTHAEDTNSWKKFHKNLSISLREEIAKIAPPEFAVEEGNNPVSATDSLRYTDIVVLKNGEILEGVHTKVTPTTLEVTESNGKKTIYKKSQVLSVKRK